MDIRLLELRPGYRAQQFLAKLHIHGPVEEAALTPYLNCGQIALFQSMPPSEQQHAFELLRSLQKQGHSEAVLAQAALLHDVGKALPSVRQGETRRRVRLWHRVAKVLLQAIHPTLLQCLAVAEPGSWRYPFFVLLHHAASGAELAAEAGTDPLAVALIYWHHTTPRDSALDSKGRALLVALQSADEQH